MTAWTCALTLDTSRQSIAGSENSLTDAIRRGADLRVYTEFRHNQHIDTTSANDELIREVAEFAEAQGFGDFVTDLLGYQVPDEGQLEAVA